MGNSDIRKYLTLAEGTALSQDEADFDPFFGFDEKVENDSCSCVSRKTLGEFQYNGVRQVFRVGGSLVSITGGGASVSINGRSVTGGGGGGPTIPNTSISSSASTNTDKVDKVEVSGKTKLVFYQSVSPNTRRIMERAISDTQRILSSRGLSWLTTANIYVRDSSTAGGTYFPGRDEVWMSTGNDVSFITKIMIHEFGHRFHYKMSKQSWDEIRSQYIYCYRNRREVFPTQYSMTDEYEFWADSFAYNLMGWKLYPWTKQWVDRLISVEGRR